MIDFNLNTQTGKVIESDKVALVIQQIDLIFDTQQGMVFGETSFGSNFYEYLHDILKTNSDIEGYVRSLLSGVYMFDMNYSVTVTLLEGTLSDIILVTIEIRDNDDSYKKTYKFE